jgi:hypothetical protein
MVMGFDGGHLVVLIDADIRLLLMHLIPDEADFLCKAGQAFLIDHRDEIAELIALEIASEPILTTEPCAANDAEAIDGAVHRAAGEQAVAARAPQPLAEDAPPQVVAKPKAPSDSDANRDDGIPRETPIGGFQGLLHASRNQTIHDEVLAKPADENTAAVGGDETDEERELAAWAAEHLDLPEDTSVLLPPVRPAAPVVSNPPISQTEHSVAVGAVVVHPVRLAAQQPQSTLPPPKKPRIRRRKECD